MSDNKAIGVFDSGLGGLTVLSMIHQQMPEEDLVYFGDSANNPYGNKSIGFITSRSLEICRKLLDMDVKAIVVACNTATSACIEILRKELDIPVIGMEPALKPAVYHKKPQKVAIWATENTLREKKLASLLERYGQEHEIRKVPTPKLVSLAEQGLAGTKEAEEVLKEYLELSNWDDLDSLVLGCTHFLFFKEQIEKLTQGRLKIYDGHQGTIKRLGSQLEKEQGGLKRSGQVYIYNSNPEQLENAEKLFRQLIDKNSD